MQSSSYYKLVLTMLTISFVSECRLWKASVLDDCLAQFSSKYVLKKEQRQAVLGLLEQKPDWLWPFYHEFWENFNLPVVRGSETQTKRKEGSISCIAIAADVING